MATHWYYELLDEEFELFEGLEEEGGGDDNGDEDGVEGGEND
jgi:hypothetical protein